MLLLLLLFALNFGISTFNAYTVGSVWDATRAKGGAAHFMSWVGATMSASGFTWCYLMVLGIIGATLPASILEQSEGVEAGVSAALIGPEELEALFNLGYMVIIFPILGSGLAITLATWRQVARSQQRNGVDYAVAGWNTFAQVSNTYSAIRHIPGVIEGLKAFFLDKDSKSDTKGAILVIVLVLAALTGGILTTAAIIQARRRAVALGEAIAASQLDSRL